MFRRWVLPVVVWLFYRLWTSTWRCQLIEPDNMKRALAAGEPIIFAHWHGDELAVVHLVPTYKIATMTSTSKDGQLIDFVLRRLGGATSRGSSTRGGIGALKGLIRLVKLGYRASMAVDGPKGPIYHVKPGVFELSRLTQARIIPVGVASSRAIVFEKSWNKARLPKLFSRVVVQFGEPWAPIQKNEEPGALSSKLAEQISDAAHQASKNFARS